MDSDAELVRRGARGDDRAFAALVQRHLGPMRRLIRYQMGGADAEDVLQETLVQAWRDLPALQDPQRVKGWLLQVARNRCRDFCKRAGKRERPTVDEELEFHVNRMGRVLHQQQEADGRVREALEQVSPADRELVRAFYLEGRSIAEIAGASGRPAGTIKRHLFEARGHLRELFAEEFPQRRETMNAHERGTKEQPFPEQRPEIEIRPSDAGPFAVDCRELRWWFGQPVVGDSTLWTIYDPPGWTLSSITHMRAVRPARIHDLDGVEIEVDDWSPEEGWKPVDRTMWGRLTDESVQWLGVARMVEGERRLSTFLDEGFADDWGGEEPRRLRDVGCFVEEEEGVFAQRDRAPGELGAGVFSVRVGNRSFTCLRVIDVDEEPNEKQTLVEAYLTESGRTVLFRRYNGREWKLGGERRPWDEALPDHQRLTIDGVTFVHWYDCLTGLACGL